MINSATNPDARLHKHHNISLFHFVRNVIAARYINLQHLRSEFNLADVVSKHWSHQSVYDGLLKPTFFFEGDTGHLIEDNLLYVDNYINVEEDDIIVIDGE